LAELLIVMMLPHHDGAIAMLFILDTPKSLREASAARKETVVEQGFGVLAVHDLGHTMGSHTVSPQRPKGLR